MKVQVKKISLDYVEGPRSHKIVDGRIVIGNAPYAEVTSWEESQGVIHRWAMNAPKTLGYDKVHFLVEWEDGSNYCGRFDMTRKDAWSINPIGTHIYQGCLFYTGKKKPFHMAEERYREYLMGNDIAKYVPVYQKILDDLDLGFGVQFANGER